MCAPSYLERHLNPIATGGKHQTVPKALFDEAVLFAKVTTTTEQEKEEEEEEKKGIGMESPHPSRGLNIVSPQAAMEDSDD